MRFFACSSTAVLLLFATQSQALPNPAATYSVVDVDGGRNAQTSVPAQAPVTIYRTITESAAPQPPSTVLVTVTQHETKTALIGPSTTTLTVSETRSALVGTSTTTVTVSETYTALVGASTTTVTVPEIHTYTLTLYVSPSVAVSSTEATTSATLSSLYPASTTSSQLSVSTTAEASSSTFTASIPTTAITSTAPALSTASYDDGFWHTSYPVRPASSSVAGTTLSTAYFQMTYSQTASALVPSGTASAPLLERRARMVRRSA